MSDTVIDFERFTHSRGEDGNRGLYHDSLPSKRLKLSKVNYTDFQPGSIIKIRLKNFVTYALTEFHLSPSLNMIIGPNGSGKSTFVCAICLGLAGRPEYIGRSKRVEDFIKNGEDECEIEITLKNNSKIQGIANVLSSDDVIKITRVLIRHKKKSDYFINDRPASEGVVKSMILQLNIQLDNLCQFLSQERVEEFARLKSDKLLFETIRSIDTDLITVLEELKELQGEELAEEKEVSFKQQRLQELTAEKERLETSVRALEEFQRKKDQLEIHKKLLPYVKIKDHKEKIRASKKCYEDAKRNLKALLQDKKPFSHAKKQLERATEDALESKNNKEREYRENQVKFKSIPVSLEKIRDEIQKNSAQINYYRGRSAKLKQGIEELESQLENQREDLNGLKEPEQGEFDSIDSERTKLSDELQGYTERYRDLKTSADNIDYRMRNVQHQVQTKIRSLDSTDRIGVLDGKGTKFDQLKDAVLFIREHPEMADKVLEPPIMSVSATDPRTASYLSTCVDFNTSIAFTVVDSESYNKFSNQILQNHSVNLRELASTETRPPFPTDMIRKMGFDGYLSDFISGDSRVIKMLCQQHRVHTIPVSRKPLLPQTMEQLRTPDSEGNLKFRRVIAGDYIYDFKRSAYGNKQIFSTDFQVRKSQFYMGSILSDERRAEINREITDLKLEYKTQKEQLQHLAGQMKEVGEKRKTIRAHDDKLKEKGQKLNQQRSLVTRTRTSIQQTEEKLRDYRKRSKQDVSQQIEGCKDRIRLLLADQGAKLGEILSFIRRLQDLEKEVLAISVSHLEALNRERSMNDVIGFFNERENQLRELYEEKKAAYSELKDTEEFKAWMTQIRSYGEEDKVQLSELAQKYQEEGSFELQHITDLIDKLNSEISMVNHDESAIMILQQAEKELKKLSRSLPNQLAHLANIRDSVKEKRDVLEPKLDEVVQRVSQRFARLFVGVGSAGAVNLEKPTLFSEWKLEIMVKFRDNATLKRLDSHTQSGGERAVSTVLYMIALQEFTTAPFRVVDEINQGMDTRNERIVHKAMVENACAENTSQYFLITPKLLTGLYYHEKMKIHCVMAGAWIPDPIEEPEKVHFGQTSNYIL